MTPLSQILSLARAGSPGRAWALFEAEGWDRQSDDPKALSLKGRLLKDQAKLASGSDRVRLYGEAAAAYAAAAAIRTDSYPLINAAALALLGGDVERSVALAAEVLDLIEHNPEEGENAYWRGATRAEALLLLGREGEARAALTKAIAALPDAWEDHAATIGQFTLILAEQARDATWLDKHRPPSSVHYSGMIRLQSDDRNVSGAIDTFVDQNQPGFAYGSLAAGSDILFAQAFLRNKRKNKPKAQLHVILPFPVAQFLELSVLPFGDEWLPLFDELLEQAETVTILGLDDPPQSLAVEIADGVAMGQAMRNAHNLQSQAKALTIVGTNEMLRPKPLFWKQSGRELFVIEGERKQTEAGEFAQEKTPESIGTLICIHGVEPQKLQALLGYSVSLDVFETGYWFAHDDQEYAYMLASKIAQLDEATVQLSMLHGIVNIHMPSKDLLARASAFASVSQPGTIMTDYSSAMALTLLGIARSVEEIGELNTAWGAQPIWRVI